MKKQEIISSSILILALAIAVFSNLLVASQLFSSVRDITISLVALLIYIVFIFFLLNHIKEALGVVAKVLLFISPQQSKDVAGWVVQSEKAVQGKWPFVKGVAVIATILLLILALLSPSLGVLIEYLRQLASN